VTNPTPLLARRTSVAVKPSPPPVSVLRSPTLRTPAPRAPLPPSMCSSLLSSPAPSVDAASLPSANVLIGLTVNYGPNRAVTSSTKLLPCGCATIVGEPMVPQLSTVEVEGSVCDAPILWGSVGAEVAFAVVYPPQWVIGVVKSREFEPQDVFGSNTLLSSERDLRLHLHSLNAGLEWLQELHHGVDAPCQIDERDLSPPPLSRRRHQNAWWVKNRVHLIPNCHESGSRGLD
jgi:hypothetical protein